MWSGVGGEFAESSARLRDRPVAGSSDELFALLTEMRDSLDALQAISSMRRRLVATIDAEGGHTKYLSKVCVFFLIIINSSIHC